MVAKKSREYHCQVVDEKVRIALRKRSSGGLQSAQVFFVQCDQDECQYVDENKLPCPLTLDLFATEIKAREEKAEELAEQRREESAW